MNFSYPWGTPDTVFQHFYTLVLEYMFAVFYVFLASSSLHFFAGMCLHISNICKDMRQQFIRIESQICNGTTSKADIEQDILFLLKLHVNMLR